MDSTELRSSGGVTLRTVSEGHIESKADVLARTAFLSSPPAPSGFDELGIKLAPSGSSSASRSMPSRRRFRRLKLRSRRGRGRRFRSSKGSSCDHFEDPAAVLDAVDDVMDDDSDLEAKSLSVPSTSGASILRPLVPGRSVTAPPTVLPSLAPPQVSCVGPSVSVGMSQQASLSENVCRSASILQRFGPLSRSMAFRLTSSPTLPATASQPITCGDLATLLSQLPMSRGGGSGSIASAGSECISVHERLCALLATREPSAKVVFREET